MGSTSLCRLILSPVTCPFLRNHPAVFHGEITLKRHYLALFYAQKIYSAKAMNFPLIYCFVRGFCRIPGTRGMAGHPSKVKGIPVTRIRDGIHLSRPGDEIMSEDSDKHEKTNPDQDRSGVKGTGPEIPEADAHTKTLREYAAPCLFERVTTLRGLSISHPQTSRSTLRRETLQNIYGKDPEIPFVKFEAAARALVCSLMERQDRMNEGIFFRMNDLRYRFEDLEQEQPMEVKTR